MAWLLVTAPGKEATEVRFAEQSYAVLANGPRNWVADEHVATVTALITAAWPGCVVTRPVEG